MNIFEISSVKQLPKEHEFYLFDESEFKGYTGDNQVYCLTHLYPKVYTEYFVIADKTI